MSHPKFRAWHKQLKQMYPVDHLLWSNKQELDMYSILFDNHPNVRGDLENIELMQWTGLKAKGIDVFEGDILSYDYGNGVDSFIIERNPDDCQLHVRYLYANGYNADYLVEAPIDCSTIIGNCYENPELLEEIK